MAAGKINVSDALAVLNQRDDAGISDPRAVAQVDVMQVLAEPCNGKDTAISQVAAFGKDEVAQPWSCLHNLGNTSVL